MADWIEWPGCLVPRTIDVRPPSQTKSQSTSLTNFTQVVPVIRPPFRVSMQFNTLAGRDEVLSFRALVAALEGRANAVRLPVWDLYAATDAEIGIGPTTHSDGASFSDGALYLTDDLDGVTVTAAQGARTVSADFGGYGQILEAGQYFGLGNDLHLATSVVWAGSVATIRMSPTARQAHAGAALRLRPFLIVRQADDDGGAHPLDYGRFTAPTLDFEEAFVEPLS